jgi:hypothetical protein
MLPPPVGLPWRFFAGSMLTPKGNVALLRRLVRFPVVVQMIAAFFSRKSLGVVPHSITPGGIDFTFADRSTQYCRASTAAGESNSV